MQDRDYDGTPIPQARDDVVAKRVGDDLLLVHLRTNRIFALNGTAARFWELLEAGRSREDAEKELLREFDVEPSELTREIDQLLENLRKEELLRTSDD